MLDRLRGTSRTYELAAYGQSIADGLPLPLPWVDDSNLEKIDLSGLFAGLAPMVRPSRNNAMKIATVARVRNVIAGTIGRLPLYDEKAGKRNPDSRSILDLPDPSRPRSQTLTWTIDQLIFYPCTWWLVTRRDAAGWPADVRLVMHDDAELDKDGNLYAVNGEPVDPKNVIRFDAPNAGLLADADDTLRRAVVIAMAAAKAEDNPVPAFELHNEGDLTVPEGKTRQEAVDQFLDDWMRGRRKFGVGYTSKGIKTQAHGIAPEQLLIEGRKRIDLEICRHMNAQAWVADVPVDGQSLTYANLTDRNKDFVNTTLAIYMTAITDRLSMGDITPAGWRVRFDTRELTQDDEQTRFANYEIALRNKWMTISEIRDREGLGPMPTTEGAA